MERNRWIVVGMDFSDGALRALEYAVEHANTVGASVACVHAYEDAPGTPAFHDPAPALRGQLEEAIALRMPSHCRVRVDPIVRRGAPWEKLTNVATELGADLIVVGADGQRGAAGRGFLGSVANRVVTTSPRSVVVVRSRPGLDHES
jgi:nucleotide-binding universal stress UspA family protein